MRIPILMLVILLVISVAIDTYVYCVARRRCDSRVPSRVQLWSAIGLDIFLIVGLLLPRRSGTDSELLSVMWILFTYMTFMAGKLVFVIVDLIACIPCLMHRNRISLLSAVGGFLGVATFLAMWWGALVNRFRIDVKEQTVYIENLPSGFDGYTIAQISDLHVGTYDTDTAFVSHLVDRINGLNPDMIVFTGDVVNRHTPELEPFVSTLSRLDANDGVYSILGNHDYGDYYNWDSPEDKERNLKRLKDLQYVMGWDLLLDDYRTIYSRGDSIALIGVENISEPPFTTYGNLAAAYPDLQDRVTKILLSHNPAHWKMEVADNDTVNVALTLSGHTHAMQMEVLGLSPAAWRYDTWGGLYKDEFKRHQLYVNIGIGAVGMPMRLGATPEITLITLRRGNPGLR